MGALTSVGHQLSNMRGRLWMFHMEPKAPVFNTGT